MSTPSSDKPSAEKVHEYLQKHQLESVLESAVNAAVVSLADNPYKFIAKRLLEHSEQITGKRVALDGTPVLGLERKVSVSEETLLKALKGSSTDRLTTGRQHKVNLAEDSIERTHHDPDDKTVFTGEELNRQFETKKEVELDQNLHDMLKSFFDKMDENGDGSVTKDEAIAYWGKNFAKVNANSMFNEVDENGDESITWPEFLEFWKNVVGSGYDVDDIKEEVEMMLEGGSWVDFDDGRTT